MDTGYIWLNVYTMVIVIVLAIVFYNKQRVHQIEDNTYAWILNLSIITAVVGVLSCLLINKQVSQALFKFVSKFYLGSLFITFLIFIFYTYNISKKDDSIVNSSKKILSIIGTIGFVLIMLFPIDIEFKDNAILSTGLSPTTAYLLYSACYIIIFLIIVFNFKKELKTKYIPMFLLTAQGLLVLVAQLLLINVNYLTNPILIIVDLIMFFTIENPDAKMIEQLDFAKKQADRANQAKTDFLSNMSHEIRTPLNAIVGFSQALSEEDCLNNEAQDEVKDIMMASENLLEIVNGILDISKIESGKLEIIAKDYSFKKVWEEIVALGRGRLGDKPLDFRTFYDESIPEVLYGDSTRIKEVVVNLLTNAIKYTKEGFVELKVSSVIKDDVCRLIISVEDSGIGIKQENIEKLFSKFERFGVEKEITIEGTGLGLAITKKLVDLMNGTIVVQSIYGKGSKFTVSIDQKIQVGHHIEDTTQSLNLNELITVDLSNKRVLVVDDNMVNLKVAARLLKDYNLMIDEVDSGEECINKVMSDVKYDLILMDDMMPKMSGTDTFHHLQELDGFNIPTIALTANAISGMKEKYLGEGFNDYLAKPIDRKELNKIIKRFLVDNKNE